MQEQAPTDLGQGDPERPHQEADGPGYPVVGAGDHGHQCVHQLHHLPGGPQKDTGNQAAIFGDDHQKCTGLLMQLKKYFTF